MRRLTNLIFILGVIGCAVAGYMLYAQHRAGEEQIEAVAAEVRRFELVIKLHAATEGVELTGRGWPTTIDPAWFKGDAPMNTLLSPDRPWVEVALPEHAGLMHPPNRIASDGEAAMFWYNPYQGVIRTRVPPMISDRRTLTLYNRLNRSHLESIFEIETPPKSEPQAVETVQAEDAPPPAN